MDTQVAEMTFRFVLVGCLFATVSACSKEPSSITFHGIHYGMSCADFAKAVYPLNKRYSEFKDEWRPKLLAKKESMPWYEVFGSEYDIEKHCKNGGSDSNGIGVIADGNGYLVYYGTGDDDKKETVAWWELGTMSWGSSMETMALTSRSTHTAVLGNRLVVETIPIGRSDATDRTMMEKFSRPYENAIRSAIGKLGDPLVTAKVYKDGPTTITIWHFKNKLLSVRQASTTLEDRYLSLTGPKYVVNKLLKFSPDIDKVAAALRKAGAKF